MAKEGWHASQDTPDWTDIALQIQEQDKESGTFTSLLIESAGGTAAGSLYIAITTRRRDGSLDQHPTVAVTQAYWPTSTHRLFEAFIFYLIFQHGTAVEEKLVRKARDEEALRAPFPVPHTRYPIK